MKHQLKNFSKHGDRCCLIRVSFQCGTRTKKNTLKAPCKLFLEHINISIKVGKGELRSLLGTCKTNLA